MALREAQGDTGETAQRRQNRALAFMLAGGAALLLVSVIALVLLIHYAETHHVLAP